MIDAPSIPMRVAISGAGIAGLSAAISLRRSGHRVSLYDRSTLNNEIGAAINVPPNVSRFLLPWGFDTIRARFRVSPGMYHLSGKTLDVLLESDMQRNAELYGGPLFLAHRVDLHQELKLMATDPNGPGIPAEVHVKSEVVEYVSSTVPNT
jgi:salicylate hydroxylase